MPPLIDEATLEKFYSDVPAAQLEKLRSFLETHTMKSIVAEGREVAYYACGQGPRTLLTFCGGHSTPDTAWQSILTYEEDYRIVVADISGFETVDELTRGIRRLLEEEGVDRVTLLGQSLAGLICQIYFKRRFAEVDGMVLINTLALRKGEDKPFALLMLRLLPTFVLKALFKKKLRSYFEKALEDPRTQERCLFGLAHLGDIMANHFTKKKLMNVMNVLSQFQQQEGYAKDDFSGWPGRVLVMSSEDDPGFKDFEWLTGNLPRTVSHVFPKGLGHLSHLLHGDTLESRVKEFLAGLQPPS